jgi:16S rRNA (uracil1498-N3)-methyltransferase
MTIRLFVPTPLSAGLQLPLPPGAARHAQVRRVQPGDALVLFDGRGGEWRARVVAMGRGEVQVLLLEHLDVHRDAATPVTLAVGMPANDRMDVLVEKATELGVAAIQPLQCERSVLRLDGERAGRRREHWQGVAVAASEQCGRTRVPQILPVRALPEWLASLQPTPAPGETRWLLSPDATAPVAGPLPPADAGPALLALSGPEGGLVDAEDMLARARGFGAVSLGPRVLRADTAPLALLAWWMLSRGDAAGAPQARPR